MHKLYLLIGGLTATLASASVASAADLLGVPAAPQALAYPDAGLQVATDNWTGFYAGAHVGGMIPRDFNSDTFEDDVAWSGGVQAGYLQQFGMFVAGAELDASMANELTYVLTPGAGLTQNWSVAGKLRGGAALGNTLVYSVVGAQVAELEGTGTATSGTNMHTGLVFGAGVEQALGNNISVRGEYLQTRYFGAESAVAGIARTDDLVNHAMTLGVNYRF